MREEIMADKTPETLTFGFDIGIASVGWCVLGEKHIVDLGARCFDKAETAKEGESLNLARRTARLMRRRLRRRAWRLTKLARVLKRLGLIADTGHIQRPAATSAWRLRVDGLDRCLSGDEWARVIYHLCKHRGFHWISRAEEKKAAGDAKGKGGRVKKGLSDTQRRMTEKGYRSAAAMVLAEFPDAQRNKQGDYGKALSRVLLADELALLFRRQRELGNPQATAELESAVLGNGDRKSGLFWEQKPALAGADLLKMLGKCTFEKDEYRAPKASFTAERHVWLTRLNNLRIVVDGSTRPLNAAERQVALPLPYEQASDLSYKQLHAALVKKGLLPESFEFAGLRPSKDGKDPKAEKLVKLPAWQELRLTLKKAGLETEWQGMAGAAIGGDSTLLDNIARVLSVFKDGAEVEAELRKLNLSGGQAMIDALAEISFDKFHALSLKALRKIVPHMEAGLRYDEACVQAGYHHSQLHVAGAGAHKYLPPFYVRRDRDGRMVFNEDMDVPKNPVVLRALNQARKVINALIRRYGAPSAVHIEMARDLSRPLDERRKVEKEQLEYRDRNEVVRKKFEETFGFTPDGRTFERYQLYEEQMGKCAYSGERLDVDLVVRDKNYAEVDHALPYSRSYDNSKNNKVLVHAKENRDKGNRTPYEYLGGAEDSPRWCQFAVYVEGNKAYRIAKKSRLLRKNFGADEAGEFKERNLNDTRYICKFFKNYVERYLQLAPKVGAGETADAQESKRCVVLSGQLTAFLRARWGLVKVRSDNDRHHALDAAVVAACSHGMVKRLADYSRRKELENARDGFIDMTTGEIINPAMFRQLQQHFPEPWPHFRHELEARLNIDDPEELRTRIGGLGTYPQEALASLRPLFVSRAPQRRNSGAAHKDTIYAQPERLKAQGGVTQKVPLANLKLADFGEVGNEAETCKLIDWHRNEKLYAAIRARLEVHGSKGDKAFPADNPLRKPLPAFEDDRKRTKWEESYKGPKDGNGKPIGPVVRTVTMVIDKLSGIPVRGGIAKNDSMLRVDVFTKGGKFHLVPVYVHHAVAKELPNRAVVAFKDEDEWTLIDDSFDWQFSVHPNDLIRVKLKNAVYLGYFASCHRGTGAFNIWSHDRNKRIGKDGAIEGIGIKTALALEKFHVDVLGNIYPAPPETRRGLA